MIRANLGPLLHGLMPDVENVERIPHEASGKYRIVISACRETSPRQSP